MFRGDGVVSPGARESGFPRERLFLSPIASVAAGSFPRGVGGGGSFGFGGREGIAGGDGEEGGVGGIDTLGVTDLPAMRELVFQGDETPAMPNQFTTRQKNERLFVSQCNALREIRFLRNACAEVTRLRIEGGRTAGMSHRGSAAAFARDRTRRRNSRGMVVLLGGESAAGEWVPAGKET